MDYVSHLYYSSGVEQLLTKAYRAPTFACTNLPQARSPGCSSSTTHTGRKHLATDILFDLFRIKFCTGEGAVAALQLQRGRRKGDTQRVDIWLSRVERSPFYL